MKENKRIRSVRAYHYDTVQICRETDVIYTRCRVCKEYKPSDLKHFMKETHSWKKREIAPLCRECHKKIAAERKQQKEQPIKIEAHTLFEEDVNNDSLETKLDRLLSYLWIK